MIGVVVEALPSAKFRVELENGHTIIAHVSLEGRQACVAAHVLELGVARALCLA